MHLRTDICYKQLLCSLLNAHYGYLMQEQKLNQMLQTVQFKKQKTKQADVGSSVDLNGYFFSITFHGRNKIV